MDLYKNSHKITHICFFGFQNLCMVWVDIKTNSKVGPPEFAKMNGFNFLDLSAYHKWLWQCESSCYGLYCSSLLSLSPSIIIFFLVLPKFPSHDKGLRHSTMISINFGQFKVSSHRVGQNQQIQQIKSASLCVPIAWDIDSMRASSIFQMVLIFGLYILTALIFL